LSVVVAGDAIHAVFFSMGIMIIIKAGLPPCSPTPLARRWNPCAGNSKPITRAAPKIAKETERYIGGCGCGCGNGTEGSNHVCKTRIRHVGHESGNYRSFCVSGRVARRVGKISDASWMQQAPGVVQTITPSHRWRTVRKSNLILEFIRKFE